MFGHINKLYMHQLESVLKNETHKILWDFEIQTNHLISDRRPDFVLINKRKNNLSSGKFCCFGGSQNKNEKKVKW